MLRFYFISTHNSSLERTLLPHGISGKKSHGGRNFSPDPLNLSLHEDLLRPEAIKAFFTRKANAYVSSPSFYDSTTPIRTYLTKLTSIPMYS